MGGTEHTFHILPHPGAVGIVALRDGMLCLIRQFRPAVERHIIEIPAGTMRRGEDPLECARRELAEETGLRAGHLVRLGGIYPTPGYSSEYLHVFLATELADGEAHFDEGEEIDEVVWMTPEALTERVVSGEIEDAKTIAALFLLSTH